ncbi:hypothetical protein KKA14_05940 [bacterium]|nr:hypothetical protein [bacterium]
MARKKSVLSYETLRSSIKDEFSAKGDAGKKTIGIELEMQPFKRVPGNLNGIVEIMTENKSGSFDLLKKETQISDNLIDMTQPDGTCQLSTIEGGNLTFEPGGQIEYSSSNRDSLNCVLWEMFENINRLQRVLKEDDIWFLFGSLNPWYSVDDVGLKMKKERYRHMNDYFASIGPYGQQMMRLTTSLQVNLDLGNPETMKRRWLASQLLSPVLTAIFGNSPFVNGQSTSFSSYRSFIWQNLDHSRTGFPHLKAGNADDKSVEEQYLEFALNANVMRLPDLEGVLTFARNDISFKKWFEEGFSGHYPEEADWKNHLTSLFPEVRPKGFLEFRSIDSQAAAWWAVPAILVTSIMYDNEAMEKVISLTRPWYQRLDKVQFQASSLGVQAFPDVCQKIFKIAFEAHEVALDSTLLEYMERFYARYTRQSRNPANELLELNNGSVFTSGQYLDYERRLSEIARPPFEILSKSDVRDLDMSNRSEGLPFELSAKMGEQCSNV